MSLEENKALVLHLWESWNNRDWTGMNTVIHPTCTLDSAIPFVRTSCIIRNGIIFHNTITPSILKAFPDLFVTTENLTTEGDMIVAYVTFHDTLRRQGPMLGSTPIEKQIRYSIIYRFRIAQGKIMEVKGQINYHELIQQLKRSFTIKQSEHNE